MFENMEGEAITKSLTMNPIVELNNPPIVKKKRNLPGTPDPEAEVIALSPKTLMATNRFLCEICGKGFQRDQNLQLHRRGHNLPWKLRQRSSKEPKKRVYVCPEKTCVHHHPSRALGDLTGIKKHFCRKHGEKKWKCEKCSKRYAVQSDWKAHSKTCGTKEYKCDCGTIFARRDSFLTHRAFCDALAEETARVSAASNINHTVITSGRRSCIGTSALGHGMSQHFSSIFKPITSSNNEVLFDQSRSRPEFSLWLGQGPVVSDGQPLFKNLPELNQNIGSSSLGTLTENPFASYLNPQQLDYCQLNWVLASKFSSPGNTRELTSSTTTTVPLSRITEVGSPQLVTAPSLYSTDQHDHHHHQTHHQASLSATALLQKAAQIGVTSTSSSSLLNGDFALKYCPSTTTNTTRTSTSPKEVDDQCNNNGILFGSNLHSDHIDNLSISWNMQPEKRRKVQNDGGGETRDFLGVGFHETICASSVNGCI